MPKLKSKKTKSKKTEPDFMQRVVPISELQLGTAMLIYGRANTGKTAVLGTFPKPLFYLDIEEEGTETISMTPGIKGLRIDSWEELDEVYWWLKTEKREYASVGLDQISQLQVLGMRQVKEDDGKAPDDPMSRRLWGKLSGMMQDMIFKFRDLRKMGYMVGFVAHDRANEAEDGEDDQIEPFIGPRVMPSVASSLAGAMSIIGNTFIRETFTKAPNGGKKIRSVQYCMRLGPHAMYVTKARTPRESGIEVPDIIVNPTFDKVMAIMHGETIKRKKTRRKTNAKKEK